MSVSCHCNNSKRARNLRLFFSLLYLHSAQNQQLALSRKSADNCEINEGNKMNGEGAGYWWAALALLKDKPRHIKISSLSEQTWIIKPSSSKPKRSQECAFCKQELGGVFIGKTQKQSRGKSFDWLWLKQLHHWKGLLSRDYSQVNWSQASFSPISSALTGLGFGVVTRVTSKSLQAKGLLD